MTFSFKKLFFLVFFNLSLFLMLMIGLQNNERKSRVNFLVDETVQLPIGFTMGISFIMGSLIGNLIPITYNSKK